MIPSLKLKWRAGVLLLLDLDWGYIWWDSETGDVI